MNAFYERLKKFGALVQAVDEQTDQHIQDWFTIIHPGHPVVSRTRSVTPKLEFNETCPVTERRRIRKLFRKAFSRTQTA